MLTVHRSLRHLAKITSTDERMFALSGVHLVQRKGRATVEASDGKRLIHADAPTIPAKDLPEIRGFKSRANGSKSEIVPAKVFKDALNIKPQKVMKTLESAAVTLEEKKVTFATTNLETASVTPTAAVEARFPDTDVLFYKDKPALTIYFDARLLGETLRVIADALRDADADAAGSCPVRLDFFKPEMAVQISAGAKDAPCGKLSALVMPIAADSGGAKVVERWKK